MEGAGTRPDEVACRRLARREVLGWALATTVLTLIGQRGVAAAQAARGTVYVFPLIDIRPHVLQKSMQGALPGFEVTVFGRVGDFKNAVETSRPDAIITLAPVLEYLGFTPQLQGVMGGVTDEKYLLVSERPIEAAALPDLTIGCIDLVGRRELAPFVARVLGLRREPVVERVTKLEDLVRLLQFRRADTVLVPARFLDGLRAGTQMQINVLDLPTARVRRTAIAFPGDRAAIEAALRALPREVKDKLGVDAWQ